MRAKNLDLLIVMAFVLVNVLWIQLPDRPLAVGIVLALPLALFFPGYALTQMLFRKHASGQASRFSSKLTFQPDQQTDRPITRIDQLLLSFGLSMAIDVMVGFGLNLVSIGLGGLSWIISLGLITAIFTILTFFLRQRDAPATSTDTEPLRLRVTVQDSVLFVMAALIVTASVWISIIRPLQPQPSFTQFWMLQANQANKSCAVSIGVQSFETNAQTYYIVMTTNNTQKRVWSSIMLQPQQKWTQEVPAVPDANNNLYIEAQLYKDNTAGTEYRTVHLTLHVLGAGGGSQQQCTIGS